MPNKRLLAPQQGIAPRLVVALKVVVLLYLFLVSIRLLGKSFDLLGREQAHALITHYTSNRFVGLFVGILATSIIQSSSTVTSIIVGFTGAGTLPLTNAIPIVIGANIGTTITNIIVSLGHIRRRREFRNALAAATVHDFFNLLTTFILFPIELIFAPLERTAIFLTDLLPPASFSMGKGPLHAVVNPPVAWLTGLARDSEIQKEIGILLILLALAMLFFALVFLVKVMKGFMLARLEAFFGKYVFRNPFLSLMLGVAITALVQSSSVTTSLLVPMAGAGILTIQQVYPFTLGANMGTTVTALIAAMAPQNVDGLRIALCHFMFNLCGILVFFPLKSIPITLARRFALIASRNKKIALILIATIFFLIPIAIILISEAVF